MMPNKNSPCKDCTERFIACSDKCPKDARGEFGYKAWKAEYYKQKAAEKEYNKRSYEDYLRSERREYEQERYGIAKHRMKRGNIYGRK